MSPGLINIHTDRRNQDGQVLRDVSNRATENREDILRPVRHSQRREEEKNHQPSTKAVMKQGELCAANIPKVLRNQPDYETLRQVLEYINSDAAREEGLFITSPSPQSAQILNVLLNHTVPDYWTVLQETRRYEEDKIRLLQCLKSVSGIGATLSRLRTLISDSRQRATGPRGDVVAKRIHEMLDFLTELMSGYRTVADIWSMVAGCGENIPRRTALWKEFVSLVASSKVLSVAAQADHVLKDSGEERSARWISDGTKFAHWLGRNIATFVSEAEDEETWAAAGQVLSKSLRLGYRGWLSTTFIQLHILMQISLRNHC